VRTGNLANSAVLRALEEEEKQQKPGEFNVYSWSNLFLENFNYSRKHTHLHF
jgi:hypothetical protein